MGKRTIVAPALLASLLLATGCSQQDRQLLEGSTESYARKARLFLRSWGVQSVKIEASKERRDRAWILRVSEREYDAASNLLRRFPGDRQRLRHRDIDPGPTPNPGVLNGKLRLAREADIAETLIANADIVLAEVLIPPIKNAPAGHLSRTRKKQREGKAIVHLYYWRAGSPRGAHDGEMIVLPPTPDEPVTAQDPDWPLAPETVFRTVASGTGLREADVAVAYHAVELGARDRLPVVHLPAPVWTLLFARPWALLTTGVLAAIAIALSVALYRERRRRRRTTESRSLAQLRDVLPSPPSA